MKIPTKKEKGFTLAETLITLTILGVVAAITVPSLINKYIESSNRTKVKKAMSAYEKALNQMIIDNDVKGAVGAALNTTNCTITTEYFKKIAGSGCRFQTSDRVWWDITDIEHPIIMLNADYNEEELSALQDEAKDISEDDYKYVYAMVGRRSDDILRVNDLAYEYSNSPSPNGAYLVKLYNFINKSNMFPPMSLADEILDFYKYRACIQYNNEPNYCSDSIKYKGFCEGEERKSCSKLVSKGSYYDVITYDEYGRESFSGTCYSSNPVEELDFFSQSGCGMYSNLTNTHNDYDNNGNIVKTCEMSYSFAWNQNNFYNFGTSKCEKTVENTYSEDGIIKKVSRYLTSKSGSNYAGNLAYEAIYNEKGKVITQDQYNGDGSYKNGSRYVYQSNGTTVKYYVNLDANKNGIECREGNKVYLASKGQETANCKLNDQGYYIYE